jgi:hypothetical protein
MMSKTPQPGTPPHRRSHDYQAHSPIATRSTRDLVNFAEEQAAILRQRAGVGPQDRLNPRALTQELGLVIAYPADIPGLTPDDYALVVGADPKTWSGMGGRLPDGRLLVLLHPSQTVERANVTIMEEVAHIHLGHRPTRLVTQRSGLEKREYNKADEDEAYWTAAAALLPSHVVAQAVWRRQPIEELAAAYGMSVECAEFRVKTLRLWPDRVTGRAPKPEAGV